jgi:hypothetical protein
MKAMRRFGLLLVAAAMLAGCEGGIGGYDPQAHVEKDKAEAKYAGKAKPEYQEIAGKDGKIYVAGSKDGADRALAGQKFSMHKMAFGYGPNKETVVFEDDKTGMGDYLEMEYKKKHAGQ